MKGLALPLGCECLLDNSREYGFKPNRGRVSAVLGDAIMSSSAQFTRSRRLSLALGTSALAWGLAWSPAAHAQCAPEPTVANGTTTCTGTDANGIRVTTPGTTLTVTNGATVSNVGAAAVAVDVPRNTTTSYASNTVNVQGSVSAIGQNAISVSSGAPSSNVSYSSQQATLTIGVDGVVTGATAIALLQSPGNSRGTVSASVDNAGTLTGTGGTALSGNVVLTNSGYATALTSFSTITNRAGASIVGSIVGPVSTLANAGSINGGAASALDTSGGYSPTITNAAGAAIRSSSTAATTLTSPAFSLNVTNAGTIANAGSGTALSGGTMAVTNQAGGQISSAGTTAIAASSSLTLMNRGTVTGNVVAGNSGSTIDSTAGTINGSLNLGSGNDTLVARYAGTRTLATGITGAINGGGGTNTERVVFAADASVTTPIDLNAGFQQLVLAPDAKVTATLESGFSTPTTLVLAGTGTVVNRATIALSTPAVSDLDYAFGSPAAFRNEGAISASVPANSYFAGLTFSNHSFTNTGTVSVSGGTGVSMSYNPVVNSGMISASGTGVNLFDGVLTNSGSIVSTAGAGINLFGNVGYTGSNSGTIRGATTGATTGIYLTNTGTISSAGTGVAVQPYGYLINAVGGVVNGGSGGAVTVSSFNAGIANAGTINGDVTFNGGGGSNSNLSYFALTGGVLNGNLALGGGATLITDIVNTGPGRFAGITGTVTGGADSTLRYAVNGDTAATLPTGGVGPFANVGYQLGNGAKLTLIAPAGQTRTQPLLLAGNGSVDLNAAITTTNTAAIQSTSAITYPGSVAATGALSLTSRGAIAVTRTSNGPYLNGAVLLGADTFTNAGSIIVSDRSGLGQTSSYGVAAIYGGTSVTNNGQIALDGGIGINNATNVTNAGTITQANGGGTARGVTGFTTLTNTGTISVAGAAAQVSSNTPGGSSAGPTITNSGTLASSGGPAIAADSYVYRPITINNQAGGTIIGAGTGGGSAIQLSGATLTNAGTITGTVDLGYSSATVRSYASSTYVAAGGTVAGDLRFGSGTDLLLQTGDLLGVSGVIDGGAGTDIYGRSLSSSAMVAIDAAANIRNFEDALVQAVGAGTVVTTTANGTFKGNLFAVGNGSVVNQATIAGTLTTILPYTLTSPYAAVSLFSSDQVLAALTNAGSVAGGVSGTVSSFTNSGTIASSGQYSSSVDLYGTPTLAFANTGTIGLAKALNFQPAVTLSATSGMTVNNSGRIDGGGLSAVLYADTSGTPLSLAFVNSGSMASNNGATAAAIGIDAYNSQSDGTISLDNTGTISAQGSAATGGSASALNLYVSDAVKPFTYTLTNNGTIAATSAASSGGAPRQALALLINGANLSGTITNAVGGVISATGERAYAIVAADAPLNLVNAGTISASGTVTSAAITTFEAIANTVRNTGTIIGDIQLASGTDILDNAGTITGAVGFGGGDDRFVQRVGGTVSGLIDGGSGTDSYLVETTGGIANLNASQIANFERVTQSGTGTGQYAGSFGIGTIDLAGGTLSVAAGQMVATQGPTTITGTAGSGSLSVVNAGTIAGGVTLADGNDTVANTGAIGGAVQLGAGDDIYVEGVGSVASRGVDGGAGTNLYRVMLAGDRTGIGARANFQNLAVDGTGLLALTLDQASQSVALNGTGLTLSLGGYSVGQIVASGPTTQLTLDGDVGSVQLGAGNDTLAVGARTLAGRYDGGAGTDTVRLTNAGAVTLAGSVSGFETVALAGNALTITGTLGSAGQPLAFAGGDKSITVARGGVLVGTIDLAAGNDTFRLAAGGTIAGTVSGGAGSNAATLDLSAGDLALRANTLTNFQRLTTEGAGTLTLAGGSFTFDTLSAAGNLTLAADAGLAARIAFGPADNRLVIAGGFAGSVDGSTGTDSIDLSGGSAAAPVAFLSINSVEAYRMSGGFATIAGTASLGNVTLTGGRLVGLAGSSMTASGFTVGQGATFGSAGIVNGNIAIAGTLSPGASPGTMTVNGNVSLAATSVSVFEITPTLSDKLAVNGMVSIASGATLQLVPTGTLAPGRSLDLVTATGGITGRFTTIIKPASLFGFVVQDASRIRLLGEFLNDPSYSGQVRRSVDYFNGVLTSGQSSAALIAAAPLLITASGNTNTAAFAQLSPEAYAAARQIGVENGLALAEAARGDAFVPHPDTPGLFTFASALGGTRTLEADTLRGTAQTTTNSYDFLGGIGFAGTGWSLGAFGGYLKDRQSLAGLGVRTNADGAVAGVHGRARYRGIGIRATVAYDGAQADTRRALPGGTALGHYDLHSWTADASIDAAVPLTGTWTLRPSIGGTVIRTNRGGVAEAGGSAFALTVAKQRSTAAFVDGGLTFAGAVPAGGTATVRPYLTIGLRYQTQGRTPYALAGLGGGGLGLLATGAARAPVLAIATLGADVALSQRLALFGAISGESGDADHRAVARAGLRLAF